MRSCHNGQEYPHLTEAFPLRGNKIQTAMPLLQAARQEPPESWEAYYLRRSSYATNIAILLGIRETPIIFVYLSVPYGGYYILRRCFSPTQTENLDNFPLQSNGFGRKHSACFSDYAVGGPLLIILHIERVWSTIVSSLLCVCLERSVEVAKKAPHLSFLFIGGPEPAAQR